MKFLMGNSNLWKQKKYSLSWDSLFFVTFLASYIYILNEWLFAITKPSFLNNLSFPQQLQIFLIVSALLASLCFLCLLLLVITSVIPPFNQCTNLMIQLSGWLPAVIFAALILIMVDNFTYTMFKFGIVSTEGWTRGLYGIGFILVIILCYRRVATILISLSYRTEIWGFSPKWISRFLVGVLLMSVTVLVFPNQTVASQLTATNKAVVEQLPHILLVTSDGMDANHMSVYGYGRETTPRIRQLAESALVAENAFSNSSKTTGSIFSIYTGKYPAKTRLFWSHQILEGDDSYEHLPGFLRSYGYKTVQITIPYYLDASKMNLLDGFDDVKMSSTVVHSKYLNRISKTLPSDKALFIDETINRIVDRVRHIFFIEKMTNPYFLAESDIERWEYLRREIKTARQPIFVHVHLMVTHGKRFNPVEQYFSFGQAIESQEYWSVDFYDDSILDVDKNIGELVDYLTDLGLLDNTILIIASDHGQQWNPLKRLPLIFRFPHGKHAGRIQVNVQNLDIAPTVLDYIGLDQPNWMHGNSLISGELEQRSIFGVTPIFPDELSSKSNSTVIGEKDTSPFDEFHSITLIYCQKWFNLDLTNISWESGNVEGSTSVCPPGGEITNEQAFQRIVEHLQENGFDVSTLEQLLPRID